MNHNRFYKLLLCCSLLLLLQACKVTQTYQRANNIANDSLYRDVHTNDTSSIGNLPWRQLFTGKLQALIADGIANNLDLKMATERIKQASASFTQSKLAFYPSLNANANATFQNLPGSQVGNAQIFEAYGNSSWQADIWGRLRSSKRAALDSLLQSEAYRRYVQTQLVASIASDYYSLIGYDAELALTYQTLENRKQDVETMKVLKESDVVTGAAVVQSEANRYSVEVTIPDIKQNIRETENAISILLGRSPGPIDRDSLSSETLYTDLRTGIPSQLLSNRPDVEEAEYQLRYAFELVNIARTYFYPSLSITAEAGIYNNTVSKLLNPVSFFANIAGGLTQPIFNNGLNKQRLRITQAEQETSLLNYKKILLTAGEEVSNALYSYQAAQDKIDVRSKQIDNLQKSVDFTQALLKYTSNTNYTDVLTSEQNLLAAQLSSISDKLQQWQAVVALYASLGGGWK